MDVINGSRCYFPSWYLWIWTTCWPEIRVKLQITKDNKAFGIYFVLLFWGLNLIYVYCEENLKPRNKKRRINLRFNLKSSFYFSLSFFLLAQIDVDVEKKPISFYPFYLFLNLAWCFHWWKSLLWFCFVEKKMKNKEIKEKDYFCGLMNKIN